MVSSSYAELGGKVAVVTGGSRGIGAETARALAADGCSVAVVGRDQDALDQVVGGIAAAGGRAIAVLADVTDEAALAAARDTVEAELGPVDLLAAFAGGMGAPTPTAALTPARWREVIETDLTSTFLTVQTFLGSMLERGHGSIVTMSSAAGRQSSQANAAYAAAKAGVVMFTRHLAAEAGPRGVRVNCLAPGTVRTEKIAARMPEEVQQAVAARHPLARLGTPEDCAAAALFLFSDASSWLTGLTVDISGGLVTH
ncbi:SDR family NAD(P)-dependent oxidoreductase [Streptacidiphilus sp. EB129]|uniref:SDR family NAD(P)-dependent oxidoreductase n=1 Tax=Streptacidiphilus sp. EB129 TaxID=3156262 RepID=UPI0035160154